MKQETECASGVGVEIVSGADSSEAQGAHAECGGPCGTRDPPSDHVGDPKV